MNYDKILIELFDRVHQLEEEVAILKQQLDEHKPLSEIQSKCSTDDIKKYIKQQICAAREQNCKSITLRASDIHRNMKLKSRFPMVCNAMRQCMKAGDIVLHETPSGYSSSLEILYYCEEEQ